MGIKSFAFLLLIITSSASGVEIQSFSNITVNPLGSRDYRAVVSVHLKWELNSILEEETIAAREAVAISLKSLKISDFTGYDSISVVKGRISTYLAENDIVGGNKIIEVYITDLIVEYTGENKAYIYNRPTKKG